MIKISDRLAALSLSETLAMNQRSREMLKQGIDVINLSIGEPDFDTPVHIKEAAIKAINDNFTHYPPVPGFQDLREAVCTKLKRDNDLDYDPEEIIVSSGAKQSLANVILSVLNPGDEVIIPEPFWVSYPEMVKLAQAKSVYIPTGIEQNYKITPEQLEDYISPKTRMFIFNSPSNPSGQIYSREELAGLAEVFERHPQILILSDEIYEHINYNGKHESIGQFKSLRDQVVVVNGMSKAFAMTGWRVGYMAGPVWLVKACQKLQGQYTSGACSVSQKAAVAALLGDQTVIKCMVNVFRERRDLVVSYLREIPGFEGEIPQGAFYVLPDVSAYFGKKTDDFSIDNADDFSMYLLNKAHVATVSGKPFGAPDCIRISYASNTKVLSEAMFRIKKAMEKVR